MNNMRRMLPAPSLRMSEGGMFNSLKRAVGMAPPETVHQKFARQDAELKAKLAAREPAPAAAPAPAPAISQYAGNSALARREKAAGLRDGGDLRTGHGGHVPGSGKGDKIPAKYEPGEFVVSNDMLDAAPELREQLGGLRTQVLAEKGMTPEEADAKALRGTGLRAQVGLTPSPPARSFHERRAERGTAFPTQFPDKARIAPAPTPSKPAPPPGTVTRAGQRIIPMPVGTSQQEADMTQLHNPDGVVQVAKDPNAPAGFWSRNDDVEARRRPQVGNLPKASYSNEGRNYPAGTTKPLSVSAPAQPKSLPLGEASPAGTFGGGYSDMGVGIGGESNRADGKVNDYTNIGADGKPTALSMMDPRTPDQVANGERIKAETAATLRNPDGSTWGANDNAIMAANLRDGIDPYRGTSRAQQDGGETTPAMSPLRARLEALSSQPGKLYVNQAKVLAQLRNDDMGYDSSMANIKQTAATARRGQDIDLAGAQATADASNRSSLRDAQIAERDFQTKRADRAEDQEGKLFERAQAARKNFTDRANTMFPGKDGKPDAEKVAQYTTFTTNAIGAQSKKMMQSKDPAVRANGQRLAQGDMSVLDATDFERLDKMFQVDQRTANSSGVMPWSGSGVRQTAPGSSEITGRADSTFQRRVQLKDGRVVPESDITGAGWFDNGDQSLIPENLRMR